MLTIQRQDEILAIIKEHNSASVKELAKDLYVSEATVRRDLSAMEHAGLIRRSHGGAVLVESSSIETSISMREEQNLLQKRMMASLAVEFVKNNGAIFMDSSTTTAMVIPLLKRFSYISIVTNGLKNALLLSQTTSAKIYVTAGNVCSQSSSITGTDAVNYVSKIHADLCLMSCNGIDYNNGMMEANIEQSRVKQAMLKNSDVKLLICDSSKFDRSFMSKTCDFDSFNYLITDKMPSEKYVRKINECKCRIITPN